MLRKKNNASLASDLLLYGHAVAAALCYYIDKRVCVLYGVGYCLLFLLFPPPMHRGATQVRQLSCVLYPPLFPPHFSHALPPKLHRGKPITKGDRITRTGCALCP